MDPDRGDAVKSFNSEGVLVLCTLAAYQEFVEDVIDL